MLLQLQNLCLILSICLTMQPLLLLLLLLPLLPLRRRFDLKVLQNWFETFQVKVDFCRQVPSRGQGAALVWAALDTLELAKAFNTHFPATRTPSNKLQDLMEHFGIERQRGEHMAAHRSDVTSYLYLLMSMQKMVLSCCVMQHALLLEPLLQYAVVVGSLL